MPIWCITPDDVRSLLQTQIALQANGNQSRWAKMHGVSRYNLADTLAGRRMPGTKILTALGLRKIVGFVSAAPSPNTEE